MKPIQIISQDLFDKVRSRFSNLEMGDSTGAVTIDPAEAIFFDFDFVFEGNNLGRVSISLGNLGSLKVYYSQGITENHDDPVKNEWFKFLKEMRFFAMRRLLRFDTRDIAKTNLDKKDFQHLAKTQGPKEEQDMTTMNETKKTMTPLKKQGMAEGSTTGLKIKTTDTTYDIINAKGEVVKQFHLTPKGHEYATQFLKQNKGNTGLNEQGVAEGGFPKKISQKEVDKFQKKHNDKLTGREVNRQEQEKKPADNNKKQGVAEGPTSSNLRFKDHPTKSTHVIVTHVPAGSNSQLKVGDVIAKADKKKWGGFSKEKQGVAEGSDVEYIVVIQDQQGKRSIRISALTPTDAKEKAEAQGYRVLKVKDPQEKGYFREQGVADSSERDVYKKAYMDGYNGKSFNSPYKPGSDEDDEYDEGWHDGRLDYEKQGVAEGDSEPGYIKYEQMKDEIASVLIKLYDQGNDEETIKQMGDRVATHLGYDPDDSIFQDAWMTSFTDASLDGSLDSSDEDDYTDYSMRQGEMGNPDRMTDIREGRWNQKSTKKTSRAVTGKTEVIVRHARPVDEEYAGSRSQKKNIKAIFIQNNLGERYKYPFIHTAGAFAMAQHVDHGGIPHDPAGKAIINMSEKIAQLQEFQRKVHRSTLHDDATGITERAIGRLQELKAQVANLGKRHHYQSWIESFQEPSIVDDGLDDVTMEQYKQKFTQSSFQEELSSFFPLLHSIMSEDNIVDLEDFVSERKRDPDTTPSEWDDEEDKELDDEEDKELKKSKTESMQFEEWADAVEQGKLTDDQIDQLKQALDSLPKDQTGPELELGPEGQTAIQFFKELGLEDKDLEDKFTKAVNVDPETNAIEVFKVWAQQDYPELAVALGMSGTEAPAEPEAGAEEEPTAENEEQGVMPNKTMPTREALFKEIAKLVKSRFNKDNLELGAFNGAPNIALDVKKKCEEMFGETVGDQAEELALQFMEKLSQQRAATHRNVEDDGLARLKELLDNVKSKVEGIGDRGQSGKDFNNNIMSAEDGPNKSEIPAAMRKQQGGDWRMSLKDLEAEKNKSPTTPAGLASLKQNLGMKEESALEAILRLSNYKK